MSVPSVSVVMPAYGAADTLAEALRSLAAQGVADFEVIVVDDASRDATRSVAEAECRALPSAQVIGLTANAGPAAARNRGIASARGAWLAFLDADDAWVPWKLELQLSLAAQHPEVALWCGNVWSSARYEAPARESKPPAIRTLKLEEFTAHNPVATSTVLIRKDAVARVGGFDPQFRGPEDYDLWMRIVRHYPARHIDARLAWYRSRPGSLSMDDRRFLPEVLRVLDKAFAAGGALSEHAAWRRRAVANQYWNASWMAFHRGARAPALGWLLRSWLTDSRAGGARTVPLLWRYLFGQPERAGGGASPGTRR
jgi:glycosyltransferase involved in cell wall biosynthesis